MKIDRDLLQRFYDFLQDIPDYVSLRFRLARWNGRVIALDFETYYDNECTVKTLGNYGYTRHPKFEAYMLSVHDGEDTWVGHPKDFNWESLAGAVILSHNAAFDQEVYLSLVEKGLAPLVDIAEWHCTANMTSYLCGQRSLAKSVEVLFGKSLSKQVRNDAKGKTWADMLRDGTAQAMLDYAGEDAVWCWKLYSEFGHKWPAHERMLSHLTIEQGRYGVQINVELLEQGIQTMQKVILESVDKLPWVKRGRAEASPIGIAEECRLNGIPGMPVKAHDPEAAEDWLETYSAQLPWVQGLKDLRRAKKMLATLETIKLRLRPDGTMPFSMLYFGAHTGRWAGAGGLNMQNLNKDPLFGFMIRDLFIARPGKKLIIVDLSQIEPRCLNWLIGNEDLLSRIRGGEAIYEAHARLSMGWTGGRLKKENPKLYALAKAQVLALGYGAGWEKFITMARTPAYGNMDLCAEDEAVAKSLSIDGQIYTDEEGKPYYLIADPQAPGYTLRQEVYGVNARTIVQSFRDNNPLITGLWRALQDNLENSVGRDMEIELPSGRSMRYKNVTKKKKRLMDKKTGELRERWVLSAEVEGYETKLYGGILTENCVAGDMEVLTQERGWVALRDLRDERVWDGIEFVSHGGLSYRGDKPVVSCGGVLATPDHKFLQRDGSWASSEQRASSFIAVYSLVDAQQTIPTETVEAQKSARASIRELDSSGMRGLPQRRSAVESALQLRANGNTSGQGIAEAERLWAKMPAVHSARPRATNNPRNVRAPGVCDLGVYESAVPATISSGLQKLRCAGDYGLRALARIVSKFLGRYGANVGCWARLGQNRQQSRIQPGQLSVDNAARELPEQEESACSGVGAGCGGQKRNFEVDAVLPNSPWSADGTSLFDTARPLADVYDILNCGPRHRFAVRAPGAAEYVIAHNCVQAAARDVFAEGMLHVQLAGIRTLWSVHDELICEVDPSVSVDDVIRLLTRVPEWMPGLPVEAEGVESQKYLK